MSDTTQTSKPLTWLITGSSSGFGLALTRLAQAKGHKVIATSRNPDRTPDLVDEVVGRGGLWLRLELEDLDCDKIIHGLEAEGAHIDVLINTAAMSISGPLESFTEAEARKQMDTNFFGPYRLIRAITPYMRKRRSGMIVNFSSGAGLEAMHSLGIYGASKAALDGVYQDQSIILDPGRMRGIISESADPQTLDMSKVLHKELEPFNVRVLLVYLGTFNTNMPYSVKPISTPLPSDYEGTQTEKLFHMLSKGDFAAPGDHVKACQAIYDVVMNEGFAKGLGNEIMLPLGRDLAGTVKRTQDRLAHMMDVFGDICHNVNLDDGTEASW